MHPPPGEGECIQSYLARLILANNLPNFLGRPMFDLIRDQVNDGEEYEPLSKLTGFEAKVIRRMRQTNRCLDDYYLGELLYYGVPNPWRSGYFAFCPLCLSEALYYKTDWGTRLCFICLKHKVLLMDCCPFCGYREDKLFYACWTRLISEHSVRCCKRMGNAKPFIIKDSFAIHAQKILLRMLAGKAHITVGKNLRITNCI